MYMSLDDLRTKFATDQAFAVQFVSDAKNVGINVDILDSSGAQVDVIFNNKHEIVGGKLYNDINLLNTYIKVVKKITETDNAVGKSRLYDYLHAPFNEPDFYIDTNSRIINVPAEFSKNGVGVVGDHLAEILFFTVPRFFDVVDLLDSSFITIYWYNSGVKGDKTFYKTSPIVKYAVGDTLYLGWAISELASEAAGSIEFFFEFGHQNSNGQIDFRLETQPAKITIKPTLVFDKDEAVVDSYDTIFRSRAIYSPIINSLTTAPAQIIDDLTEGTIDLNETTGDITLHINAVSPDDNNLIYQWNWNGIIIDQPNGTLVNDSTRLPNTVTYELVNNKNIAFSNAVNATYTTWNLNETDNPVEKGAFIKINNSEYVLTTDTTVQNGTTYYKEVPAANTTYRNLKTNIPGTYQVYVGNENSTGGIRYVYSAVTRIEAASEIVMDNSQLPGLAYLDSDTSVLHVEANNGNGTVTYQWYKNSNDNPIVGATAATFDPSYNNLNVTDVAARGEYYCIATNTKNNTVEHAISNHVMIESVPTPVDLANITLTQNLSDRNKFTVTIANLPYPDIKYQMYANIAAQVPTTSGYETKIYDVASSHKVFADGTTEFSIQDLTQMYSGQTYDLQVYVVPISQYGTTYQRYATKRENNVLVPAYTRIDLDGLVKN